MYVCMCILIGEPHTFCLVCHYLYVTMCTLFLSDMKLGITLESCFSVLFCFFMIYDYIFKNKTET